MKWLNKAITWKAYMIMVAVSLGMSIAYVAAFLAKPRWFVSAFEPIGEFISRRLD